MSSKLPSTYIHLPYQHHIKGLLGEISINPYENMHNSLIKFLLLRSILWNRINCYSNKLSTSTTLTALSPSRDLFCLLTTASQLSFHSFYRANFSSRIYLKIACNSLYFHFSPSYFIAKRRFVPINYLLL